VSPGTKRHEPDVLPSLVSISELVLQENAAHAFSWRPFAE
jgi:hypothetical protein